MGDRRNRETFFAGMALFYLASCLVHPVTPSLIVERGLDSSMFGVALAAMHLMNFLFSPLWGRLCRRYPVRLLLPLSCLGYCLGQGVFACAFTEAMILGGRMFAGIFVGGIYISASTYVVETSGSTEARGENLAVLVTMQSVLNAVGYFVGGMLGTVSVGFAFGTQSVLLLVTALVLRLGCRGQAQSGDSREKLTLRQCNPFGAFLEIRGILTPMLFLLFSIVALGSIGQNAFEQCFNFCLKDQFGLSSACNGILKAAIAVVSLLVNGTLGLWLVRRTRISRSFFWVMVCCTLPLMGTLFFRSLVPLAVLDVVFFGFNALRLPMLQNLAASQAAQDSGSAVMGFYNAMKSLGAILGSFCAGLLYDAGPFTPFLLAAGAFLGATVFAGVYRLKSRKTA